MIGISRRKATTKDRLEVRTIIAFFNGLEQFRLKRFGVRSKLPCELALPMAARFETEEGGNRKLDMVHAEKG